MNDKNERKVLSKLRDLSVTYHSRMGPVSAVDHVSFDIYQGEIIGLVGESGCGKSTLGKAMMRMIASPGEVHGHHYFEGEDVMAYGDKQLRDFRGRCISMIFQDPMTSLNPVQRVDEHVIEAIKVHEPKTRKETALDRAKALIERLGIQQRRLNSYPHQLSGGMRQRVMIGLGLVLNAALIVADEATTSLDVIVEAKLVDQMKDIRDEFGVSILMITHNIALVAQIADRLAVMYAGRVVELGTVYEVFDAPKHPYTRGLLSSVPTIKLDAREELFKMPGEPPNLTHPPSGCRFHPRCPDVMPVCSQVQPDLKPIEGSERLVHCWLYHDPAEKMARQSEVTA